MSVKKEDYLYLSSLLRAREIHMLSRDRAERMLDAPNYEDCAKLLAECGYEDMSGYTIKQIEDSLSAHRAAVFHELEGLIPDVGALDLFRLKYDYHNVKVLIKAEAQNRDDSALLSDSAKVEPEVLLKRLREEKLRDLPGQLGPAAEEAKALLARSGNPQLADFLLDKAYFAQLHDIAEELDSDFARGYVQVMADATNLRSAVRIQRMGKDIGYLREALVPGGSVSEERVVSGLTSEGLAAVYAGGALEKAAQLGADAVSGGLLTQFELACDNAVAGYLSDARRASFGDECVLGYLAGMESELTAARMILTGRLAGVPSDTVRERLRDLYA